MKTNKKGISLIVLIITIIVIIILAAAIILSMTKTNPIRTANKAVNISDLKTAQEAVTLWIGDRWSQEGLKYEVGGYYSGTVDQTTPSTIYYSDSKMTTPATQGTPIKAASTSTTEQNGAADTYVTSDFGLAEFDEFTITNNYVTQVVKGGVTLTYNQSTGVVTTDSKVSGQS